MYYSSFHFLFLSPYITPIYYPEGAGLPFETRTLSAPVPRNEGMHPDFF